MIPLARPTLPSFDEIESDVRLILETGRLTNFGPFASELERRVCRLLGVRHALCVASATTGLMMLLNVLPKGSDVLVPSFTFLPTVQAILWNDLNVVFVDIDPGTLTMCPAAVKARLTDQTSAILGVHVFGNPCAVDELQAIARDRGVWLFFDGAHGFGARSGNAAVGTFGDGEVFSLSATKILPCGEGGLIVTNNESLFCLMLDRRNYGFENGTYDCMNKGINGKITEFSAILGLHGLDMIESEVRARKTIADRYRNVLGECAGLAFQVVADDSLCTYKDFTILVDESTFGMNRDAMRTALAQAGIETAAYFSPPVHRMRYFEGNVSGQSGLDVTEAVSRSILSLPIYSRLTDDEFYHIVDTVLALHAG